MPRTAGSSPGGLSRLLLIVGIPFIAAVTVAGTYRGYDIIVAAGWVALSAVGMLLVRPVVGIAIMTAGFLLAAYPTVLQSLGVLSLNNLIGLVLLGLLAARILETGDFSFLKIRQVQIFLVIGLLLLIGTYVADWQFPLLKSTLATARDGWVVKRAGKTLDKTARAGHDFTTRLAYLIFFSVFVSKRNEVRALFLVFAVSLYLAVPSALYNWMTGQLARGFRIESSVTSGSNPNRLGMICLIEMALFWHWSRMRPTLVRQGVAFAAIAACILVLMATGSRSAVLGLGLFGVLIQTGAKRYRVPPPQIAMFAAIGIIGVLTVVPQEAWERMLRFNPEAHESGASSTQMRQETIERAWEMAKDYPLFGVGLGNFREVSAQYYQDEFYRPPHNSYLWALSEGGIFVLIAYGALFWVTWKDLLVIRRYSYRDPEIEGWASAIRVVFLLFFLYSALADLWLNPLCYALLGLVITTRRYVESLPDPYATQPVPAAPARLVRAA